MLILHEKHEQNCDCSICGNSYDKGAHYGLNIPKAWRNRHSWFWFKYWNNRYVRFTL